VGTSIYVGDAQKISCLLHSYCSGEENESHLPTQEVPRHLMHTGHYGFNKQSYSEDGGRKSNFVRPSYALQLITFKF
jgi:hypothetical protein